MMTADQIRMSRRLLGWTCRDLAVRAGVSERTVIRAERPVRTIAFNRATAGKIEDAFRTAGVELIPENGGGVGVSFRKPGT